jgi:hypothetical protein
VSGANGVDSEINASFSSRNDPDPINLFVPTDQLMKTQGLIFFRQKLTLF